MNALVGEKLSIITSKAQTTRHRIHGMVNTEDAQLVFSDTPGIVDPAYKMHESMLDFVLGALEDADILLFVTEPGESKKLEKGTFFKVPRVKDRLASSNVPILLVINKIDLIQQEELENIVAAWQEVFPKAVIYPISALRNFNIKELFDRLVHMLPECPPYFPKDELTDKPMRFFISEMIREKILMHYKKEIPYSSEVVVESYKDIGHIVHIRAEIIVSRNSQKGIIIGHQGKMLKRVGTEARKDIEAFIDKKVHLELYVRVDKDWRNNDNALKKYGYRKK